MVRTYKLLAFANILFIGCFPSSNFHSQKKEPISERSKLNTEKANFPSKFWLKGGAFTISSDGEIYFIDLVDKSIVRKANLQNSKSVDVFIDLKEWIKLDGTNQLQIDDIWVDKEGRLILAESITGKILRISKDARKLENLADSYDGYRFSRIQGLKGTDDGEIFVGSPNSATVYRLDPRIGKLNILNEDLVRSNDFTVNATGDRLVLAESNPNRIIVYDLNATAMTTKSWKLIHFTSRDDRPSSIDFLDQEKNFLSVLLQGRKKLQIFDLRNGELFKQIDLPTRCFRIRAHNNWIYLQTKKGIIRKEIPSFK